MLTKPGGSTHTVPGDNGGVETALRRRARGSPVFIGEQNGNILTVTVAYVHALPPPFMVTVSWPGLAASREREIDMDGSTRRPAVGSPTAVDRLHPGRT